MQGETLEFDDILVKYLGEFGLFQIILIIFTCSTSINYAFNTIDYTFIGAIPEYLCDTGFNFTHLKDGGLTDDNITKLLSPEVVTDGVTSYDQCNVYVRNYSSLTVEEAFYVLTSGEEANASTISCSKWSYSQEQFTSTIVTSWDLVCDKEWLIATSQVVFMAGKFTIVIGGWLADKFGRKPFSLSMLVLHVVSRSCAALSYDYNMFLVARFFMSVAAANWYTTVIVLCIEMVGPKWRVLAGQAPFFCWSIGYMICAPMGYFIRDWRILTFAFLIFVIPYLTHFCLLPESVRWLSSNNKHKAARNVVTTIAKVNRKQLPEVWHLSYEKSENKVKSSYLELFKSVYLMKITLILCLLWFVASFTYYGLIYYLPKLGGDMYIATFISGALEIPALLYIQFALDTRLGRRLNACGTFVISGVCLLLIMFVPKGIWTLIAALSGRFAITSAYAVVYLYSSEIFPTLLRGTGLAFCINISGFGGLLAPYFVLLAKYAYYLPPLVLGILAVAAGLLSLLLPETRRTRLLDTIGQFDDKTKCDTQLSGTVETVANGMNSEDKV